MSAAVLHATGGYDPRLPLREQACSLRAEIEACAVFQREARVAWSHHRDARALARLQFLVGHEADLRAALAGVELRAAADAA